MTPSNASHRKRWEFVQRLAEGMLEEIQEPTEDEGGDGSAGIRIHIRNRALSLKRIAEGAIIDFPEE